MQYNPGDIEYIVELIQNSISRCTKYKCFLLRWSTGKGNHPDWTCDYFTQIFGPYFTQKNLKTNLSLWSRDILQILKCCSKITKKPCYEHNCSSLFIYIIYILIITMIITFITEWLTVNGSWNIIMIFHKKNHRSYQIKMLLYTTKSSLISYIT